MSTSGKQTQVNLTIEWLRAKHPQLADAVLAGMPVSDAWDKSQSALGKMSELQGHYSIVQYLAQPDRLEFINIGVVLFASSAEGALIKIQPDFSRLNKLFGKQDRRQVQTMYEALARRVHADARDLWSHSALAKFAAMRSGHVQLSQPLPVLVGESAEETLNSLFDELVAVSPGRQFH